MYTFFILLNSPTMIFIFSIENTFAITENEFQRTEMIINFEWIKTSTK